MVRFRAKSKTNPWCGRPLWYAAIIGMTSVSLIGGGSGSVQAELFPRPKIPKPVDPVEPQANSSFDNAVRKLLKEAKLAESKGEIERALILAERAAKISESSAGLVKSAQDVSPEVTARYARELRSKRTELLAKKPVVETSKSPRVTKISVPPKMRKSVEKSQSSSQFDDFPPSPTGTAPLASIKVRPYSSPAVPREQPAAAAEPDSKPELTSDKSEVASLEEPAIEATGVSRESKSGSSELLSNSKAASPSVPDEEETPFSDDANSIQTSKEIVASNGDHSTPKKTASALNGLIDEAVAKPRPDKTIEVDAKSDSTRAVSSANLPSTPARKELRGDVSSEQSLVRPGKIAVARETESMLLAPVTRIRKLRPQFIEKESHQEQPLTQAQPSVEVLGQESDEFEANDDRDSFAEMDDVLNATETEDSLSDSTELDPAASKMSDSESDESDESDELDDESEPIEPAEVPASDPDKSIKLRPAFRDFQVKTSSAIEAETLAPMEDPSDEIALIASTDLSADSDSEPPMKSFKLRPLFRDPRFKTTVQNEAQPNKATPFDESSSVTATEFVRKPVIGRTSMIHWRTVDRRADAGSIQQQTDEIKSQRIESGDHRIRRESASGSREGRSDSGTGSQLVRQSSSAQSTAPQAKSSTGSAARVPVSNAVATRETQNSDQRELRGSLWDNATAPSIDSDSSESPSMTESSQTAPVPPRRSTVQQTSFSMSNSKDRVSKSHSASRSKFENSKSAPAAISEESDSSTTTVRKKKRPNEDDHAASTRAILSSGPIQQLAKFAGVTHSTASAMLSLIGITLLIFGLWMIRANLGIKRN